MDPVLFRYWAIKIKPKSFLRPLRDFSCEKRIFLGTGNLFPVTTIILSFTGKLYCETRCSFYSCHRKYSYFHRKNPFCDRYYTPFVTGDIVSVTERFSCDTGIFYHVTGNFPTFTRGTLCVCVTRRILSVKGIIFHFAMSQQIFFL